MKLFYACASLLLLQSVAAENPTACLAASDVVDGTDYFPDKVSPEDATQWTVEYFETYKIAVNVPTNERYLLYQCGIVNDTATLLDDMVGDTNFAAIVPIPLTEVGLLYTTMVPYMELLGLRTSISAILSGSAAFVSSPCVLELVSDGTVEDVPYTAPPDVNATDVTAVEIAVEVAFVGEFGDNPEVGSAIRISETSEPTNMAVLEWIKFYSLFFNAEAKANEFYSQAKERQLCVEGNAAVVSSDVAEEDLPTVVWGYYSDYCGGWDVARNCPNNYYCQMATSCSANLLWSEEGNHTNPELCFDAVFMTTEEFVAFASNADYFIYAASNWEDAMTMFGTELSEFVSVKAEQVYDYQGQGPNAWFEQRLVEPDVVLQDFCAVVGTDKLATSTIIPHKRQWFRNVFTEPVGSLGECADVTAPLVSRASPCSAIPGALVDANKPGDADNNSTEVENGGAPVANGGTAQASSSTFVSSIAAIALVLVSAVASVTMM